MGKGPTISFGPNINPVVAQMMVDAAKQHERPYQRQAAPGAPEPTPTPSSFPERVLPPD